MGPPFGRSGGRPGAVAVLAAEEVVEGPADQLGDVQARAVGQVPEPGVLRFGEMQVSPSHGVQRNHTRGARSSSPAH